MGPERDLPAPRRASRHARLTSRWAMRRPACRSWRKPRSRLRPRWRPVPDRVEPRTDGPGASAAWELGGGSRQISGGAADAPRCQEPSGPRRISGIDVSPPVRRRAPRRGYAPDGCRQTRSLRPRAPRHPGCSCGLVELEPLARRAIEDEAVDEALAEGRAMTIDEAVAYAENLTD